MRNQCFWLVVVILIGQQGHAALGLLKRDPNRTNPDITATTLLLGRIGTDADLQIDENANGFHLQEAEFQFTSNVDPYFVGVALISIERDPASDFEFSPEEVYVETLSLPMVSVIGMAMFQKRKIKR